MEHNLFKPRSFDEGKHGVVGDCNGFSMQQRWEAENPIFAEAILRYVPNIDVPTVLDYGTGVGRLAKAIIEKNSKVFVTGVDASGDMLSQATKYINDVRFIPKFPEELDTKYDVIYCVYVLQHVPSIEMREILMRIHSHLKDDGVFVYCSSDYRMSIRFDGGGFFDDRFLGVNIQEEIQRLFDYKCELFTDEILEANPIVKTMVKGGLPHPAKVYTKKSLSDYLHIKKQSFVQEVPKAPFIPSIEKSTSTETKEIKVENFSKLLLLNRLAPGDILVMTNAIRDLALAYPNKYQIDVRTPCPEIFENNPHITKLTYKEEDYNKINNKFCSRSYQVNAADGDRLLKGDPKAKYEFIDVMDDILVIDMHYPNINRSGLTGNHFGEGHVDFLSRVLGIPIASTEITPEIFLSQSESNWLSPVTIKKGLNEKYWVINAGSKGDYSLKQYPFYQEVVNLLKDKIKLVQIGLKGHNHTALDGVIDFLGETNNSRELFRTIWKAEGVITCVSFPMHIAGAFKKPCVIVSGAREGTRWELYPNHQFLYVNGCLPCAPYDGCWKSKPEDCQNKVGSVPKCMTLIKPQDVANAVLRYYEGGMCK